MPRNAKDCSKPPDARKRQERIPYRFQREHCPADTLISNFQPPELRDNKLLLFKATQFVALGYSNHRKLIQHFQYLFCTLLYQHINVLIFKNYFLKYSTVNLTFGGISLYIVTHVFKFI